MVRGITAAWNIGDPEQGPESIIIERVRCKEILVFVVTGRSPEISNLLWFAARYELMD